MNTLNIIKDFFVKNPQKLSDLVKKIIEYYEPHKASCNKIYLYHDRSGFKSEANSKTTLAQDVENMLRLAGWQVYNKTPNTNNPSHILKFRLLNDILEENNKILPFVRINEELPKPDCFYRKCRTKTKKKTLLKKTKALSGQKK